MILHLGVIDLPYADKSGQTTGDVAEILEEKYRVMQSFVILHRPDIEQAVGKAYEGLMESVLLGAPVDASDATLAIRASSEIEETFRTKFIDQQEMDGSVLGVPTKASLKGVSKRFKMKRGPRRPSFVDTGLYRQSFKVWSD